MQTLLSIQQSEQEKAEQGDKFIYFCETLEERIKEITSDDTKLFDYVDPATGIMIKADNYNFPYYEHIGVMDLLKYPSKYVGNCRVIEHPELGSKIYPASFFTTYDKETVERAINDIKDDIFN
ncbi:unnamed protein product [Moneuplotes crassus]|uniref:Uncharacterized protein n=1 Tax=Euplotes crassus TaxID=5936 RepID=A0AAD1XYL3_EUPCR|nr:unnamed protein product [Moneuplotes crassus]